MGQAKRREHEIKKQKKKFIRFSELYKLINPRITVIEIIAATKRRNLV